MNRYIVLTMMLLLISGMVGAQTYRDYYSREGVSGKITAKSKIVDYKDRKVNELRFYNDSENSCRITGYVKVRYTEIKSGKNDYKEKRFVLDLGRGQNRSVNCYFVPSWSRYAGVYEPIGFYVESVKFSRPKTDNGNTQRGRNGNNGKKKSYNKKTIIQNINKVRNRNR